MKYMPQVGYFHLIHSFEGLSALCYQNKTNGKFPGHVHNSRVYEIANGPQTETNDEKSANCVLHSSTVPTVTHIYIILYMNMETVWL